MKINVFNELGDAKFAWQVTGVRDGLENQKVILDLDKYGNIIEDKAVPLRQAEMKEHNTKLEEKRKAAIKKKSK